MKQLLHRARGMLIAEEAEPTRSVGGDNPTPYLYSFVWAPLKGALPMIDIDAEAVYAGALSLST